MPTQPVVAMPFGAVEDHGPHLPLLVDWLGAEELARVIAPYLRRAGWRPVLVPSLPYGASPLAEDWPGTVSLSTATLRRVVLEIIRGLTRHGFRRFVLTNYQADLGHLRAMALIKRSAERGGRAQVLFAGFAPGPSNAAMVSINSPTNGRIDGSSSSTSSSPRSPRRESRSSTRTTAAAAFDAPGESDRASSSTLRLGS